jgi:hypothetical protein
MLTVHILVFVLPHCNETIMCDRWWESFGERERERDRQREIERKIIIHKAYFSIENEVQGKGF